MGLCKRTACLILAFVLLSVPARAEAKYRETALTVPAELSDQDRVSSLSVHGNTMDMFLERRTADITFYTFRRLRSDDGGKTWKEQDMSWFDKIWEPDTQAPQFGVRSDGTVYTLVTGDGHADLPKLHYGYSTAQLYAYKDGAVRTLFQLDSKDIGSYRAAGQCLSEDGDIALGAWALDLEKYLGKKFPSRLMTFDSAGKQKTSTVYGDKHFMTDGMDGKGALYVADNGDLLVVGASDGKVRQKIPLLNDSAASFSGRRTCAGGALYELTGDGLFRFRSGDTSWTKLLDASVCRLGTAGSTYTSCSALTVDEDGSISILLTHSGGSGFREEIKARTFTRCTPQS